MRRMWMTLCLVIINHGTAHAQTPPVPVPILEIIKQGVVRVIKAVDLKIQRLQNETIWLQHAQKVMENTLSKLKLEEIAGWVEQHKVLYENYFDELWRVRDAIVYYHRVRDITSKQGRLLQAYQQALFLLRNDKHFSALEIEHMEVVYNNILRQSMQNVDQLFIMVNAFATQMTDAKRLAIIDDVALQMDQHYADLLQFNQQNQLLSLQRAKDERDWMQVKELYGIK